MLQSCAISPEKHYRVKCARTKEINSACWSAAGATTLLPSPLHPSIHLLRHLRSHQQLLFAVSA